ncbi:hypothetical protein PHMEG_00018056, partial [Phytophthora megakarya]
SYPWAGQYLWYDPKADPDVYLAHWRWCMACRLAFLLETWGYYATVHRMESRGHRALFWWDGQPGRHQPHKNYKGSLIDDLGVLFKKKDADAFLQRFRDAMRSERLDRAGFPTLTALLEQTDAFNPDDDNKKKGPDLRLTDRVWLKLCSTARIRALRVEIEEQLEDGTYELSRVAVYKEEESQKEGCTPMMNGDGDYTALPPAHRIPAWDPVHGLDHVINLSDDLEEGEADQADDTTGVSTCSQGRPSSFIRPTRTKASKSKSK